MFAKTKSKTHLQESWWFVGSLWFKIVSFVNIQLSQFNLSSTCPELNQYLRVSLRIFNTFYFLSTSWLHSGFFVYSSCLQTELSFALAHLTYRWKVLWKKRALKLWKGNVCQFTCLLPSLSCPDLWGPCRNRCRSFRTLSSALWWDPGSPNPPVSDLSWACHSLQRHQTKSHRLINQPERLIQKITDGSTVC